jgi:transketolase
MASVNVETAGALTLGPRRGIYIDISRELKTRRPPLSPQALEDFEFFDLLYRSLCAVLYNYVPMSGHPGGSISSGRIVAGLLFDDMEYDLSRPERDDADIISYAAGHKAMGLYAMWALRTEVARIAASDLLPRDPAASLRIEDLLGFRRNPVSSTPLFARFRAKPLDGHPTPATPFVRVATGASGVGVGSAIGLAVAALDTFGEDAPRVHILEGEGGLTPGRVSEALAAAATSSLRNVVLHVDWNQASIDSDRVCRDGETPGDYVQWNPAELAYLHDWNVVFVPNGFDFQQVVAAQRLARELDNDQPTAIVYSTTKGWQYGIEGKGSHGGGHSLCSRGYFDALAPLLQEAESILPRCKPQEQRCASGEKADVLEECLWDALQVVRTALERERGIVARLEWRLESARERLDARGRWPRAGAPRIERLYAAAASSAIPDSLRLEPGTSTTLRGELGRVLGHLNQASGGSLFVAAADLLGSTSVSAAATGFPAGYFNGRQRPGARILSSGGICEDAMTAILSGISSYGQHVGVGASYGAFLAPLGHVAARLHAIGNQARCAASGGEYRPLVLVCAHAGLKTGEDGPTHADPQALQLLQENFPPRTAITLTPWDPQEIWYLVSKAFSLRPAIIAPFVTRPPEKVLDREKLGLAPASACQQGLYCLRPADGVRDGTIVIQESGVAYEFLDGALPRLLEAGIDVDVYYVASAELFDAMPAGERETIFPEWRAHEAMGITGFTLPTMYRWVRSDFGRSRILHPYRKGHYLGSGQARKVLAEAGLDAESQFEAVVNYVQARRTARMTAIAGS